MKRLFGRIATAATSHVPTREQLEANRWLKPFAHHVLRPDLWRFNRRSVPRAVALGVGVGIAIPFMHSFLAPVLAVVARANVPVAVVASFTSNPFTWPVMWWAAYRIGQTLFSFNTAFGLEPAAARMGALPENTALAPPQHGLEGFASAGLSTLAGLVVEALVVSVLVYLGTALFWRLRIGRKWRSRGLVAAANGNPPNGSGAA